MDATTHATKEDETETISDLNFSMMVQTNSFTVQSEFSTLKAEILSEMTNMLKNELDGIKQMIQAEFSKIAELSSFQPSPNVSWEKVRRFYQDKLKAIASVQAAYIRIDGDFAEIIIQIEGHSLDLIKELARIEVQISDQFPDLYFNVEYEREDITADNFERFYYA